jgi:hypothetical protein
MGLNNGLVSRERNEGKEIKFHEMNEGFQRGEEEEIIQEKC